MLKSKRTDSAPDRNTPTQPRTGHGSASVIARLNEQICRLEPGEIEEPAGPPEKEESSHQMSPPTIGATPQPS